MNRPYLESLTSAELSRLADCYGIDIPPDLERVFIIEEILDAAGDEGKEAEGLPLGEAEFREPVPLPKQYNITFIEVLVRDPLWVFTFWEVKGHDREVHELAPDFEGYCLRAAPAGTGGGEPFTVPVGPEDNAWYLGFPPAGGRYTVALCVRRGEEEQVLAVSPPFSLPRFTALPPEGEGGAGDEPGRLSGLEDFPVLRNVDRPPRVLRRPPARADDNE